MASGEPHPADFSVSPAPSWRDLAAESGAMPEWLPRVAMADNCSSEGLIVAAASAGDGVSPAEAAAVLTTMDSAGLFLERPGEPAAGGRTLRPEVLELMLAELERTPPGGAAVRRELLAAGLDYPAGGLGPQLAKWALDAGDWASLGVVWMSHNTGELVVDPRTRTSYAAVPPMLRARFPGLSFAQAVASAYDPELDMVVLDRMMASLIRDGHTLHADWARNETAEAQVLGGAIRMLAQATDPESGADPLLQGSLITYSELSLVVRDASLSGGLVSSKALTLFHSAASFVAIFRGDWSRARRQGEFAMILSDLCTFPGFMAALVVASSSAVSGNTQHAAIAEKFLAQHAAHGCRAGAWIEPAFHLVRADSAIRVLDRELAGHHLHLQAAELTANRWFNVRPMHATVMSTAAILWDDPEWGLAQFDSIVADSGREPENANPWGPSLLRCRAELLLSFGAVNRVEPIIVDLLASADDSVSAVPAALFYLYSGDFARTVAKADEGIYELEVSLADRGFLYAAKSAALHQAGAAEELVASAAVGACAVCEQAGTLVPFAALPSPARTYLVTHHERHHRGAECFVTLAFRRGAFDGLRDTSAASTLVRLTRREEVLLPLLATSATVKEIADQQYVSVNTVRKQVVALREKLGAATRPDLIRRAHQLGLLTRPAEPGGRS